MKKIESLQHFQNEYIEDSSHLKQFNIYRREDNTCSITSLQPNRRDFYKISLITKGRGKLSYGDKTIHIEDRAILFANPTIAYAWEPMTDVQEGYFCLFTEDFVGTVLKTGSVAQSPLFKVGGNHVLVPDDTTTQLLVSVFEKMMEEMQSNYINKYELLRSYVQIVMHEAMKVQPAENITNAGNSTLRTYNSFIQLLEAQFPIDSPTQNIKLRNANEFADRLSIHTNHLNKVLKETTGKTTSQLIASRIIKEAKALLRYSNWDISQIAYSLGFDHPANFHIFFKRETGQTPKQTRLSRLNS